MYVDLLCYKFQSVVLSPSVKNEKKVRTILSKAYVTVITGKFWQFFYAYSSFHWMEFEKRVVKQYNRTDIIIIDINNMFEVT